MSTAFALAKTTSPNPLTFDQVTVVAPGGLGLPSSATSPSRLADAGRVTVWSAPAETAGDWWCPRPREGGSRRLVELAVVLVRVVVVVDPAIDDEVVAVGRARRAGAIAMPAAARVLAAVVLIVLSRAPLRSSS